MKIDLQELIHQGLIDEEAAERIRHYYKQKADASGSSRFLLILSLIGVVLVGLGLILIAAYNWDNFSKGVKILISFFPLLIAQVTGIYVLRKKQGQPVWSESVSLGILFALGLAISLLSQIYNIEADISGFIKWWIILSLTLPFIFQSRSASLALWIGVGWYLTSISWSEQQSYNFFPLLVIGMLSIWYVNQCRKGEQNNLLIFHHWTIPIILTLFLFFNSPLICERFVIVGCLILFLGFGALAFGPFSGQKYLSNGYRVAQFLGIWIIGMMLTFDFFWSDSVSTHLLSCLTSGRILLPGLLLILLGWISVLYFKKQITGQPDNMVGLGLGLIAVIFIGELNPGIAQFFSNLLVLAAASKLIYHGVTRENLIVVNLGLLAVTVWVLAWFFGHDFSFIWKGMLFIALGLMCFGINAMIIKKQRR